MRLSGASLVQSLPNNDFRTVASGTQHGFVGGAEIIHHGSSIVAKIVGEPSGPVQPQPTDLLARRWPDTALVTPITVPMNPVMYPSDRDREGTVPPQQKRERDMTNEIREWDTNGLDAVVRFLLVPIALSSIALLVAMAVGPNAASAKPKAPKFHVTPDQVQVDCVAGNGTFTLDTGSGRYGCAGTGGTLSCTAKGNCTFTSNLPSLTISRSTTIENLVRGEAGAAG